MSDIVKSILLSLLAQEAILVAKFLWARRIRE